MEAGAVLLLRFPAIKQFPRWKFASGGNEDAFRDVDFDRPTACLDCGKYWGKYNLARALTLVERHGSAEIKALLADSSEGPKPQA